MDQAAEQGDHAGRRHRVVVIGSGFGGLFTTQALKDADADVTLIAKTSHHLFQPLLYQSRRASCPRGRSHPRPARSSGASATPRFCSVR